jgi:hypothetical protein
MALALIGKEHIAINHELQNMLKTGQNARKFTYDSRG